MCEEKQENWGSEMKSRITGYVSEEEKARLEVFVKKGMFRSLSEACRVAVSRLITELDARERKKVLEKMKMLGKNTKAEEEKVEKEMKELVKYVDELY